MKVNFSITEPISNAVSITKNNWYILAAIVFCTGFIASAIGAIAVGPSVEQWKEFIEYVQDPYSCIFDQSAFDLRMNLMKFVSGLISIVFAVGLTRIYLDVVDGKKISLDAFKQPVNTYVDYVVCTFIAGLIIAIGIVCCILPGIYFAARLYMAPNYVIDRHMSFIDAISASWKDSEGNVLNIALCLILIGLFNFAGYILCCVGALYTLSVGAVASVILYRTISRNQYLELND